MPSLEKPLFLWVSIQTLSSQEHLSLHLHNAWWTTPSPGGHCKLANTQLCEPSTPTRLNRLHGLRTGTHYSTYINRKALGEDIPPEERGCGRLVNASGHCQLPKPCSTSTLTVTATRHDIDRHIPSLYANLLIRMNTANSSKRTSKLLTVMCGTWTCSAIHKRWLWRESTFWQPNASSVGQVG